MDKAIVQFINKHYLLALATSKDNLVYCCNVYYVFNQENNSFIFSSDTKTKHAQDFIANPNVAGTIEAIKYGLMFIKNQHPIIATINPSHFILVLEILLIE